MYENWQINSMKNVQQEKLNNTNCIVLNGEEKWKTRRLIWHRQLAVVGIVRCCLWLFSFYFVHKNLTWHECELEANENEILHSEIHLIYIRKKNRSFLFIRHFLQSSCLVLFFSSSELHSIFVRRQLQSFGVNLPVLLCLLSFISSLVHLIDSRKKSRWREWKIPMYAKV